MYTKNFAMIAGIIYLAIGILGFFPVFRQVVPSHAPHMAVDTNYGYLFGLFPVNIIHNLVHLAVGAWGLWAYKNIHQATVYAKGLTILYGVLTIMGFIPWLNVLGGLVPLFGHNIWLHAVTAIVAAYFGFVRHDEDILAGRQRGHAHS